MNDDFPSYTRCQNGHIDPDSVTDNISGTRKCLVVNGNPASWSGYCHAEVNEVPIDQAWYDHLEGVDLDEYEGEDA